MNCLSDAAQREYEKNIILADNLRAGDRGAFDFVFQQHFIKMHQFMTKLCNDEDYAADLVQEAFFKLWNSRSCIKPKKGLRNYLYTIMLNLYRDEKRCQHISYMFTDKMETYAMIEGKSDNDTEAPLIVKLRKSISELPDDDRAMLYLIKTSDMTYSEVARIYGIHARTVRRRVDRLIDKLVSTLKSPSVTSPERSKIWLLI